VVEVAVAVAVAVAVVVAVEHHRHHAARGGGRANSRTAFQSTGRASQATVPWRAGRGLWPVALRATRYRYAGAPDWPLAGRATDHRRPSEREGEHE
jgi:hypothetical protein